MMAAVTDTLIKYGPYIGFAMVTGIAIFGIFKKRKSPKPRVCGVDYPKDTVVVHQFPMGKYAPSLSHFVVKLETYLRVTNIPYEPNYAMLTGPKKKFPWIEYNGQTVSDTQFIIEFLNKEFNKDLDVDLDTSEKAIGWAIQRWLEESTYWSSATLRWQHYFDEMVATKAEIPMIAHGIMKRKYGSASYKQGSGRYTKDELEQMMIKDLNVLSTILGDKRYLMGGDSPTTFDCAMFGQLVQYQNMPDSCLATKHLVSLTNLNEFVERIKTKYWPDWNERTKMGLQKKD